MTVVTVDDGKILLHSGRYFSFTNPWESHFNLEDIAHGLSMTCRFAGQCDRFYSVAQHCVHVSELVPLEHEFAALMHDASEAFVGDVSKPLKALLPDYRLVEERVEAAISAKFSLPQPLSPCIKVADLVMLATEQRQIMRNHDDWVPVRGHAPLTFELPIWSQAEAKAQFLRRYAETR